MAIHRISQTLLLFVFAVQLVDGPSPHSLLPSVIAADPPQVSVPDQKFTNSLGMQFVKIPAGEFQMGTTNDEGKRFIDRDNLHWSMFENEKPAHQVRLTKDYYLGKYEVTVAQFRKFIAATNYETNAEEGYNALRVTVIEMVPKGTWRDPKFKQDDDHPVVCVTTSDAQNFVGWLNKTDEKKPEGWEYRLPTEAEWEYAARGPKGLQYPWGDSWREHQCRPAPEGMFFSLFKPEFVELRTHRVGLFSPRGDSPFGVSDMCGNVSEWCEDWYGNYPKEAQTDPLGPAPGTVSKNGLYASPHTQEEVGDSRLKQTMHSRVFRGSSWLSAEPFQRLTTRSYQPKAQVSYIGFRVALAPILPGGRLPAPRAVQPRAGETIFAPTKSSRERMAAFKADAEVTEQLYKEIVAADQMGLLVALGKNPERAVQKYYALIEDLAFRCKLSNRDDIEQRPPTVGELGLLLLAGCDPRMPQPANLENPCIVIKGCREIVIDEPKSRRNLLRQMIKSWMSERLDGNPQFTSLAREYDFKDFAREFAAYAVDPDTKPEMRYNYLTVLIDLGSEEQLQSLAPLLNNEELPPETLRRTSSSPADGRLPQQWRDLTLIVLLSIAGEDLKGYGLLPSNDKLNPTHNNRDLAFPDEAARETALEKWSARDKNPKRLDH